MKRLNSVQRTKIKQILENARAMKDSDLETLRNSISASDGNLDVREVILEGIVSLLNKEKLTHLAIIPEADLTLDEC